MIIPILSRIYKDGGTRTYSSLSYKIVRWNKLVAANEDMYQKTSIFWVSI